MTDGPVSKTRDRLQNRVLRWTVVPVLAAGCLAFVWTAWEGGLPALAIRGGVLSLAFALVVWKLRAATAMGAVCGGMICLSVTVASERGGRWPEFHSGLVPLMILFLFTFLATKLGKRFRRGVRSREDRVGRSAGQVVANLGAAALVAMVAGHPLRSSGAAMLLAALAEATADTVSSEIGQGFGGTPRMVTTGQEVPAGTDGAVTLLGTFAGIAAASLPVVAGVYALGCGWGAGMIGLAGGVAGLFFDSLLGATAERKGWLGNDLVNFSSTGFAVGVAWVGVLFLRHR